MIAVIARDPVIAVIGKAKPHHGDTEEDWIIEQIAIIAPAERDQKCQN